MNTMRHWPFWAPLGALAMGLWSFGCGDNPSSTTGSSSSSSSGSGGGASSASSSSSSSGMGGGGGSPSPDVTGTIIRTCVTEGGDIDVPADPAKYIVQALV